MTGALLSTKYVSVFEAVLPALSVTTSDTSVPAVGSVVSLTAKMVVPLSVAAKVLGPSTTPESVALENPEVQDIVPKLNDILASINEEIHNEQPDIDKLLDEDLKFHQEITKTIHNSQIETVNDYIVRISIPSRRESIQKWLRDGKQDTFVDLHRQIIDVIEKRDTERIVEVIKDHYVYWK